MMNILNFDLSYTMNTDKNDQDTFKDIAIDITSYFGAFNFEEVLSISNIPYVPAQGDKIYFLPDVTIPRIKFKNICIEHDIKTIRDFTQANIIIGSKKSLDTITESVWKYQVPTKMFQRYFEEIRSSLDDYDAEKLNTALEFYTHESVSVNFSAYTALSSKLNEEIPYSKYSNQLTYVKEEYIELFKNIQNKTIIDQSSVIVILNGEDASIIDETMFNYLSNMLTSSDLDNRVLAMEIMANSKYRESLIYLEILCYKHGHLMAESHTKTHVNFKSLIQYLNKYNDLQTNIDDVVKSLVSKNQFTSENINILLSYASGDILSRGDTNVFTVKSITLNSEYSEKLNENYKYQCIDDYIPVIQTSDVDPIISGNEEILESEFATEDNWTEVIDNETIEEIVVAETIIEEIVTNNITEDELETENILNNTQTLTKVNNDTDDFEWF